jgi:tripartite-type tricarboxylate transporter receptor subunit TctC
MTQWYGVIAPARTPVEIIERLHSEIARINANQKMLDAYVAIGVEAATNTPDQFRSFLINEIKKWTIVIAKANISGD